MATAVRYCQLSLGQDRNTSAPVAARGAYPGAGLWVGRGRDSGPNPDTSAILSGNGEHMTDFLTNLVGRTLGVTPTARPLIAPVYAPATEVPVAPPEADDAMLDTAIERRMANP